MGDPHNPARLLEEGINPVGREELMQLRREDLTDDEKGALLRSSIKAHNDRIERGDST